MENKINPLKDVVFFSSTFRDFKDARSKILLGFQSMDITVEAMELFSATATPPITECKKRLEDSQIYLLVIGEMYGTIDKETGLSITEIEYNYAIELYKKGIIKDIWVFKPTSKYQPDKEHKDDDEEKIRKLKEFKEKVCKSHTSKYYDNLDDLRGEIYRQCYVSLKIVASPLLEKAGINAEGIKQIPRYETKQVEFAHEKKKLPLTKEELNDLELHISEMNKMLKAFGTSEINPEKLDVKSVTMLGNYYYVKQEFDKAKEMYDLILKHYPNEPRALNNKGAALRGELQRKEAAKLFEKAAELDKNYTDPKVNLGGLLCELNRAEEGIKFLDEVYIIEKDNPDYALLLNLGFAHSKLGNNKVAHDFYNQAEKLAPTETQILMNIATLYQGEKNYEKAIEYTNKILEIDSNHSQALATKGSCFLDQEYFINGIDYLEKSRKQNPNEIVTLVNLCLGYRRMHDYSKMNTWYVDLVELYALKAIEIKEDDLMVLDHLGWCYNRCGRYEEAIRFFDKALLKSPNHVGTLMDKAEALKNQGKTEEVLDIVNKVIKLDKEEYDLEILCLKYNLFIELGKIKDAEEFIESLKDKLDEQEIQSVKKRKRHFGRVVTT